MFVTIVSTVSLFISGSQLIKKDKDGSVISAYVDRDGIQYKHTHLDIGMGFGHVTHAPHSGPVTSNERMSVMNNQNRDAFHKPVVDMMELPHAARHEAAHTQQKPKEKKHSSKLVGFFSRLASFRFNLRKGAHEKDKVYRRNDTGNKLGES